MRRLLLVLALYGVGARAGGPAARPIGDEGRFVVTRVLIDPVLDNMQQRWFGDDPRLLGRIVTVASNRLEIDSEPACTQPRRAAIRRTVAQVLRANSQRRNAAAARAPTPRDFGLAQASPAPVTTVVYRCLGPDTGQAGGIPGHGWDGAVGWTLGDGRRALLWTREALLVLTPVARASAPRPSFACAAARTVTERAICADASLAGWDRSVAAAYRLSVEGSDAGEGWVPTGDPDALADSQQAWLIARDRCGADRECLLDRMAERTDALMRRQY